MLPIGVLLLLACSISCARGDYKIGDKCTTNDKRPGICATLGNCPKSREEYFKKKISPTIFGRMGELVCCPLEMITSTVTTTSSTPKISTATPVTTTSTEPPPPSPLVAGKSASKCKEYAQHTIKKIFINSMLPSSSNDQVLIQPKCDKSIPLVVGGRVAKPGAYPHMAAIGWQTIDDTVEFRCGGSLISERFVLTAAHCSRYGGRAPSLVRLGNHNLKSRNATDFSIEDIIIHEKYQKSLRYNDIALIKLAKTLDFTNTNNIRPACLWQTPKLNITEVIITGWGSTKPHEISDDLMEAKLDIIENSVCNNHTTDREKLHNGVIKEQICAGFLEKEGIDACVGDSGGPLQVTTPKYPCLFHVVGITSFGSRFCGAKYSQGVYTRVSSYLEWIERNVWP